MSEKSKKERKPKNAKGGKGQEKGELGRTSVTEGATASPALPPRLKAMKNARKPEGEKVVLKCQALSENPSLRFKWQKDGKEITKKNCPDNVKIKMRKKKRTSELHISNASHADAGEYACTVSDRLGSDTKRSSVDIVPVTTTPTIGTGHLSGCNENQKSYCVNGGECFLLKDITSTAKYVCKCPNMFTGVRCQNYVMTSFYKAEELNQKKVWTVTGICIALLAVGIMCVLAYCKAKKQRKKFHDRLRQSLHSEKNKRVNSASGPHHSNPPPENVQLVNQYVPTDILSLKHVIERETETSFSGGQYTCTRHHSTMVTQTSSRSWSRGQSERIISESHHLPMTSSVENSRHASPMGHRGRLNGVGGPRDGSSVLRHARDSPYSYKHSPDSERYASDLNTPARMSPVDSPTSCSTKSPLLEIAPPVSSLTLSVPSVALSPIMEEEKPLLLLSPPQLKDSRYDHYCSQQCHSHLNNPMPDGRRLASNPLRIVEDKEYETAQEYEFAQEASKKLRNSRRAKRTKPNGHISNRLEIDTDTNSESKSPECQKEDDRVGGNTPFLGTQIPLKTRLNSAAAYRLSDCRTNPSGQFCLQEELQSRLSSVIAN